MAFFFRDLMRAPKQVTCLWFSPLFSFWRKDKSESRNVFDTYHILNIVYINLCFFLPKRNQIRPFLSSDSKAFYLDFIPKIFSWNTVLVCVFLTSTSIYVCPLYLCLFSTSRKSSSR